MPSLSDRNSSSLSSHSENTVRACVSLAQGRCSVMVVAISRGLLNTPKSDYVSLPVILGGIATVTMTTEMHSVSEHAAQGSGRHRGRGEGLHPMPR